MSKTRSHAQVQMLKRWAPGIYRAVPPRSARAAARVVGVALACTVPALACSNDSSPAATNGGMNPQPPGIAYVPICEGLSAPCGSTFRIELESDQAWDYSPYFFRVAINDGAAIVCQVAFDERVVGAVLDTCSNRIPTGPDESGFRVEYHYDHTTRKIDALDFGADVSRVDLDILVSDDRPALVSVQHTVVTTTLEAGPCEAVCTEAEPLLVQV